LTPAEGATVSRSFVVTGRSKTFEGGLVWRLRLGSTVVRNGSTTGGSTSTAPFQFTVNAPAAGTYLVRVFQESAKDGAAENETTRTVVVR
jgi:hypothetical protein